MGLSATVLREGTYDEPVERVPGDFQRHAKTGAPYVADPVRTTKRDGKRADLIAECALSGITVPDKVTVAQLHELLGGRPCKVQYGRPSGFGKYIELATAIQKWAERCEALGFLLDPDILADLDRRMPDTIDVDDQEVRAALDAAAAKAQRAGGRDLAAERGTHMHAVLEDHDNGIGWVERARLDGPALGISMQAHEALVAAWRQMLEQHGFEILAVEATCVDDRWRLAGTLDRIVRLTRDITFITANGELVTLPAGWVGILDLKTGKLSFDDAGFIEYWRSYAIQVASYAQSLPYDTETDTRSTWEEVLAS